MREMRGEMLRASVRKAMPEKVEGGVEDVAASVDDSAAEVLREEVFLRELPAEPLLLWRRGGRYGAGVCVAGVGARGRSGAVAEALGMPLASLVAARLWFQDLWSFRQRHIGGEGRLGGAPGLGFRTFWGRGRKYRCCVTPYCSSSVSLARSMSSKRRMLRKLSMPWTLR